MKKLTVLCVAFAMALTSLAGCKTTQTTTDTVSKTLDNDVSEKESDDTTQSDTTKETRTVSTAMGDIEVPINPQRVVVNWYVGDVIGLGLNLVGYYGWVQETMPFYEELNASTKIENWEAEEIMSLEPDLIVTYQEEDFDKFSGIAPVLVISESAYSSEERFQLIGDATGRSEEAKEAINTFQTNLEAAKKDLNSGVFEGKTFSILQDWGTTGEWAGVAYETGSRGGTLLYNYIQLSMPDKLKELIAENGEGRGSLSYEVAHEYFGDYILWFLPENMESEYAKMEVFKNIPAVKEGNLVEIPYDYMGLFYYDDIPSLSAQLDYMVEAINTLAD